MTQETGISGVTLTLEADGTVVTLTTTNAGVHPTAPGIFVTIVTTEAHFMTIEAAGVHLMMTEATKVPLTIGIAKMILVTGHTGTVLAVVDVASPPVINMKTPGHLTKDVVSLLSDSVAAPRAIPGLQNINGKFLSRQLPLHNLVIQCLTISDNQTSFNLLLVHNHQGLQPYQLVVDLFLAFSHCSCSSLGNLLYPEHCALYF